MTKISVVTVSYNAVKTLAATMNSVLTQTFDDFEYVVVDGNSTDGSKAILERFRSPKLRWISEPDKGVYDAMNKAVALSKGEWIYFIGADDLFVDNEVLARVARQLVSHRDIVYGNVIFKTTGRLYDGEFSAIKLVTRNISHQAIFYPREVFQHYKFDTRYRVFADYHLNLILFGDKNNWTFKYIPERIAIFDDTGMSGSGSTDINFENDRLSVIRKHMPYGSYIYRLIRTTFAKIIK